MAEPKASQMRTAFGRICTAMAAIAPGAFLWIVFILQAGAGVSASAIFLGALAALSIGAAAAIACAEIARLHPASDGSCYFVLQALLCNRNAVKHPRMGKFFVGWGSHLYHWICPGVVAAGIAMLAGSLAGFLFPSYLNASHPGPVFMAIAAVGISLLAAWIAEKGIAASRAVNVTSGAIQIVALCLFCIALLGYRVPHPNGSPAQQLNKQARSTETNQIAVTLPSKEESDNSLTRASAVPRFRPRRLGSIFIQATIGILILAGFESAKSTGAISTNPSGRSMLSGVRLPIILGIVSYSIAYLALDAFLHSGFAMQNAASSAAPIGDMLTIAGDGLMGRGGGRFLTLAEALATMLALIGVLTSLLSQAARATFAMGRDEDAPEHFGMLHARFLTPRRTLWTLAAISAVVAACAVSFAFAGTAAPSDATIAALPHGGLSSFGYTSHEHLASVPNSLLTVVLTTNFGVLLLYGLSCFLCIAIYRRRPERSLILHTLIPGFGLLMAAICTAFYVAGPAFGLGTLREPLLALGISAAWGIYGGIYFLRTARKRRKAVQLSGSESRTIAN